MSGDSESFAEFYRAMFPVMLREAKRSSGRDEPTCLDLVQESMLKAIKSIKPIANQHQVEAWSRAVVKSVTWDWLRRQSKTPMRSFEDTAPVRNDRDQDELTPGEIAARLVWLEEELQSLPTDLRSMIALRYRLGWTLNAIGAQFGLRAGAVDGRIRRAVERLKSKASREYDHE